MKKVYVITEDSYYWNMVSNYTSNGSKVMFVFSSRAKAIAQLNKIAELNNESCWWSGNKFDAQLNVKIVDDDRIRQDVYSQVFTKDGEQYKWTHYISIVQKDLNSGYAI